ncbi:NADP-dependent oxidoreductase domain-containing protein [Polychytrium aggregatum]|uniref:NADP-dependent oxidoreductase domain-containing protein n=1 Tax=Polychytrium aggregatum TaxID=110093 RepID=UPI0022FDBBB3|nr:NADP-dependent oxidoreductase domain-containing protein [Polychytrium aggregatum]KAI9199480.1 NADP-dependent oxidoreductase domain-containing protein [Polychytrium aggregatum]
MSRGADFVPAVTLADNRVMPSLGLGTYRLKGELCQTIIKEAIRAGYRLIDTAAVYKNEAEIGAAIAELIAKSEISRSDIFITSKIAPKDQGYDKAYKAVSDALVRFGPAIQYIDLMLIHWPGTQGLHIEHAKNPVNRRETWRALEQHHRERRIRSIGVSNFTVVHLQDLLAHAAIRPVVNQFELHPLLYQRGLVDFCSGHSIQVEAYASLGEGRLVNGDVEILPLKSICQSHNVTPAQALLRWAVHHGWVVIPKASSTARLHENLEIFRFKLSPEEIKSLDDISRLIEPTRFCWDPTSVS